MDINYYKQFEPIGGKWYITKELGSGSFGTVFEIERKDFGDMKAALKVVSIPNSSNEVKSFFDDNYDADEKSVTTYFYSFVEEFIKEFQLMSKLKGHSNIVSYEDHDVIQKKDSIGWDIFIRMELLTPMNDYFRNNTPTQEDVIKIGIDICRALETCKKFNIIHRDIKPSNIFISDTGDFKLGDFGVARTLEKTSSGLSKKGTYTYMAPEVFKGEEYNSNVDIYSLGIVMYKLLNNNMEPFRTNKTYGDSENAIAERMKGSKMSGPANADERLAEIILKACEYSPKERFENPTQMRIELENLLNQSIVTSGISTGTVKNEENPSEDNQRIEEMSSNKEDEQCEQKQNEKKESPAQGENSLELTNKTADSYSEPDYNDTDIQNNNEECKEEDNTIAFCPECGADKPLPSAQSKFCKNCGYNIYEFINRGKQKVFDINMKKVCPNCRIENPLPQKDSRFCRNCGFKIVSDNNI